MENGFDTCPMVLWKFNVSLLNLADLKFGKHTPVNILILEGYAVLYIIELATISTALLSYFIVESITDKL